MNILLIAMDFYGYEFDIVRTYKSMRYNVDLIYDTPYKINKFTNKEKFLKKTHNYQANLLKKLTTKYDYVITIVGRFLSTLFLEELKNKNENAIFVLYLWDDVRRVENFSSVSNFYDKIFSFDRFDCKEYSFSFLPLFYTDDFKVKSCEKKYDLYGSFWNHSDRLNVIHLTINNTPKLKCYFYIKMGKISYIIQLFKKIMGKSISNENIHYWLKSISRENNIKYMCESKAILDIQFPSQKGLTLRTIESIGVGIKLITTNEDIKYYDFYNPNNILIIDRENPIIDEKFLKTPYMKLNDEIYDKYSINNWARCLLYEEK